MQLNELHEDQKSTVWHLLVFRKMAGKTSQLLYSMLAHQNGGKNTVTASLSCRPSNGGKNRTSGLLSALASIKTAENICQWPLVCSSIKMMEKIPKWSNNPTGRKICQMDFVCSPVKTARKIQVYLKVFYWTRSASSPLNGWMLRKRSFKSDKYIITSLIEVEYELIYV